MIIDICNTHDYIFTVEDNVILGGAGTAVNEVMAKYSLKNNLVNHRCSRQSNSSW